MGALLARLTQVGEGSAVKEGKGVLAEQGHWVVRGQWGLPLTKGEGSLEGQVPKPRGQ